MAYEVHSKVRPWLGHLGNCSSFELVASGKVIGMGPDAYTRILGEGAIVVEDVDGTTVPYLGFQPVHAPGMKTSNPSTLSWRTDPPANH